MTLRLAFTTGLLQPLYRFSSLARLTHSTEKNEDLFFLFLLLSCFNRIIINQNLFTALVFIRSFMHYE